MYLLTVISASILLDRKDAFIVLACAIVSIVVQISSEVFGLLWVELPAEEQTLSIFYSPGLRAYVPYFITLLTGYLTQQLRDVGQRLRMASRDIESLRALNEQIIRSISSGLVTLRVNEKSSLLTLPRYRLLVIVERTYCSLTSSLVSVYRKRITMGGVRHWENEFRRPDGDYRILNLSLSPLRQKTNEEVGWTSF